MFNIRSITHLLALICLLLSGASWGQSAVRGEHIDVALISEYPALRQGENWVGVLFSPDPHWHTYWQNPGDSGEAPALNWQLPQSMTAGDIQWPVPAPIRVAHLVNYGYEGDALLMVPLNVTADQAGSSGTDLTVDVSWLVCKEDCIPGWATLTLSLPITGQNTQLQGNALFAETRQRLPAPQKLEARHEINDTHLVLELNTPSPATWQVLPLRSDVIQHNAPQQAIAEQTRLSLVVPRSDYYQPDDAPLYWLLTDGQQGFYLQSTLNAAPAGKPANLLLLVLMAFAGGLLLNLMPCVLPVLAIKALSLQKQHTGGWAYLAGVMLCFNLFVTLILMLKQAGLQLGWGFHLQQPFVVAALAFLFTYIALILFDAAPGGNRLMGMGQQHTQGGGHRAEFATGVLAVIVASPCTAPFMAAALGVALVSEPLSALLIFNALGLGFALPMTLVSRSSRIASWLPKPGPWMQTFRQLLAFPMLATVCWLIWVYLQQTSAMAQFALLLGLVLFSLFLWLADRLRERAPWATLNLLLALSMLVIPVLSESPEPVSGQSTLKAQSFSEARLSALRADNQVVLVNMTADWCITCKVNEQVAFATDAVQNVLQSDQVHYLEGDWTNKNAEILAYLTRYERAGVPLYVVYAGTDSYQVLPQVLTPGIVVNAVNDALSALSGDQQDD